MPPSLPRVFLLPGRDRRFVRGSPWVFSNEIRIDEEVRALPAGTVVALHRVDGKPLGIGTFNAHALIAFRLLHRDPRTLIDGAFIARRLRRALALRERLFTEPYYRLVHAEADGLPGLVVDRFAEVLVVQLNSAGMERLLACIGEALDEVLFARSVVWRRDSPARAQEGLPIEAATISSPLPDAVPVREGGLTFFADVRAGQKTGWFFDQRENRAFVAALARGGRMLDAYCYSGGFALSAAAAGAAEAHGVDSSAPALDLARRAAEANGLAATCSFRRGEAFQELARLVAAGDRFRVVAADPPAFVKSRRELKAGLKGYRKLTRLAAPLVEAGGFLFIASCSHHVEAPMLVDEGAAGLAAAGRSGRIIRAAGAGPDHPVHPRLPETAYLKTLVLHLD